MLNKVLVTGGMGLIGSHLSESLLNTAQKVFILDDLSTGSIENLKPLVQGRQLEFVKGSVLNEKLVLDLMSEVDFCFHLAAALGVKKILDDPYNSLKTNLLGSENVFFAASKVKIPVFLASTSEVYGKNPSQPLTEDSERVLGSPLKIRWTYSEAKALDESMAQIFHQKYGLDFLIGRFFNTVGARQIGTYGMVLPNFVQAAIRGEDLEVYGNGTQTRVFCHVKDAVSAMEKLVQNPNSYGEIFNIGGSEEISILELAHTVIEVTGSTSGVKLVPYEEAYSAGFEETNRRVPDTTKLRKFTDWEPKFDLKNIISDVASSMLRK